MNPLRFWAASLVVLWLSIPAGEAAGPVNDMFTNAAPLSGSSILVRATNTTATAEAGEPRYHNQLAARSVWWKWQAPANGKAVLNATNGNSRWRVLAFKGDVLTNLTLVSSNTPVFPPRSAVFDVTEGQEYKIVVDYVSSSLASFFYLTLNHYRAGFVSPTNGSVLRQTGTLLSLTNLPADATNVTYFNGTNFIASVLEPPFTFYWVPEHTGTNLLNATIYSPDGSTNMAWPVGVTVLPANDDFASASVIASNVIEAEVNAELRFATVETNEPSNVSRTVWWSWTPQWDGIAHLYKEGGNVLHVYTGTELTNLVLLTSVFAGADPSGTFQASAGAKYFFQLDGPPILPYGEASVRLKLNTLQFVQGEELTMIVGSTQQISLKNTQPEYPLANATLYLGTNFFAELTGPDWGVDFSTNVMGVYEFFAVGTNTIGERRETPLLRVNVSPVNDLFANAELILAAPGNTVLTGNLAFATHEQWEEMGGRLGSLWYRWVAPFSAYLQMSVEEGAPEVRFFTGESVTNLTLVTNTLENPMQVVEGTSYYIAMDAYSGYDGPFGITLHAPPVNDDFAGAITITNNVGQIAGSNRSAWSEAEEMVPDETFRRSIWFKWTAPETGNLNLGTHETLGFTAQFAAYVGSSISNLQTVVAPFVSSSRREWGSGGWTGIPIRVRAGVTYHFRLSGYSDSFRIPEIILSYSFEALPNIPVNDDFSGAVELTGLTNAFWAYTSLASREPGEPPASLCDTDGRTLWYEYVPEENGMLYLFAGDGQTLSASFALYKGTNWSSLSLIASACALPIMANVTAGEVYYFQIDSSFGRGAQIYVDQRLYPAPANDDFENAVQFEGTNLTYHGNIYAATLQAGEKKANAGASGKTVWISWLAPSEGRAVLRSFSSHVIGLVQVYQGSRLTNLVAVPSVWDNWQTFYARAGEIYHLQFDGQDGSYGDFALILDHEPFPEMVNDNFADSRRLAGSYFSDGGSVIGATTEPGEPRQAEGEIKSLWWHWQAPITGFTTVSSSGSMVPVILAVYKGDQLELLDLVGKGTNMFTFAVQGGETYRIAAIMSAEARGLVRLQNGSIAPRPPTPVAGNILPEGSFEGTALQFQHWQIGMPIGGYVNERGGADGETWPVLQGGGGSIWQDFATQGGEQYELRFAVRGENEPPYVNMRVTWEDRELGVMHIPGAEWSFWHWTNHVVTARSNVTRLKFENLNGTASLDAVSVVWLNEPPSVHTQPASISAYVGGAASFSGAMRGIQPISYQWFFDGAAIAGATNRTLFIESVSTNHVGKYYVEATNQFGFARSSEATLTVQYASAPEFVLQPYGSTVLAADYHVLEAAAIGTPPLKYQWYFNGAALENATNSQLVFTNFQAAHVGAYRVDVSNYTESAQSLTVNLKIGSDAGGGAEIYFMNFTPHPFGPRVDARVYDIDGVTGLNDGYVAQLYAGRTLEEMRPAGQPVRFLNGFNTGVVVPTMVILKNVAPWEKAFIQMRAWDPTKGATFEVARALGGKFGRSEVLELVVQDWRTELVGLKSFNLQAGLPEFSTGRLSISSSDESEIVWRLEGAAGFKYLIERSGADFNWRPYQIVSNETGTVTFSTTAGGTTGFYRSRIID